MIGIDPDHLRQYVIRPALEAVGLWSEKAEALLLGTAAQESACGHYLHQLDDGPAIGIFQMERATHDDVWDSYLVYRPDISSAVRGLARQHWDVENGAEEMAGNLLYAAAMCRIHYRRVPEPLPDADDLIGQAHYWKRHYNTLQGKGKVADYIANFPE